MWRTKVRSLPDYEGLESWGPSESQIQEAARWMFKGSWDETAEGGVGESDPDHDSDASEEANWTDVFNEGSDDELLESVEAVAFADEYRKHETDDALYERADYPTSLDPHRTDNVSPKKCAQEM